MNLNYIAQEISDFSPAALSSVKGFSPLRRKMNATHQIRVAECAKVWADFMQGKISPLLMQEAIRPTSEFAVRELSRLAPHIFSEAMTTSDFVNLTDHVMDRMLLANFPKIPATYQTVCKINPNIRDFRSVERWATAGGEGVYQRVGELGTFNRRSMESGKWTYKVAKYEGGAALSWEAVINDDLNMFAELPMALAEGGVRTIEQFYLNLIANTTGPHTSFYGSAIALPTGLTGTVNNLINLTGLGGTGNINPPLTLANIILATGLFMNLMTFEGRPINVSTDKLVVMVADGILYQTLMNIVETNQISSTILGGQVPTAPSTVPDLMLQAKNWIAGRLQPVYAPELRNIMTSNASTAWWLFAMPGLSRRPAIELGFLQGFATPQLYRKLANTVRVGGGEVPEMGDYEIMGTEFKSVLVMGGTRMDPRLTMASKGTGSA